MQATARSAKTCATSSSTRLCISAAGFTAGERHDVELAGGAHQQAVMVLNEHDPAAVRGHLGEVVAHSVAGSADNRLRLAAATLVKGNPVQVILDLGFIRVIGVLGLRSPRRIGITGLGSASSWWGRRRSS